MLSEKKKSFMEELDEWTEKTILAPVLDHFIGFDRVGEESDEDWDALNAAIKKFVREKVLESYRNGQKAAPRPSKPAKGGLK